MENGNVLINLGKGHRDMFSLLIFILKTCIFQVLKGNFLREELSVLKNEISAIEEITQTLPDFCPASTDHSLEV